jgi:hypothetical protein
MRCLALLAVLLVAATASAEGLAPGESMAVLAKDPPHRFAIAVNEPFGWKGFAIAGSAYARVAEHHVLRLNVARYHYPSVSPIEVMNIVGGYDSEVSRKGRLLDVGAGWIYFPRRAWEGPTFEAGVVYRSLDTEENDYDKELLTSRDGQTVAARALLGWSWLIRNRVMVSLAMGASKGYSFGTEVKDDWSSTSHEPTMTTTGRFGEWKTGFEGYLRFGFTFGGPS